jgi:ATPase subunit of ABC transporter with duplicated ATPase domains
VLDFNQIFLNYAARQSQEKLMLSYVIAFPEVVLFASHDQEFVYTVANRIIEITQGGAIDRPLDFEDDLDRRDYLAEAV